MYNTINCIIPVLLKYATIQQLYISCAQITVITGGSVALPEGVDFPGAYTDSTPGIHWNVYISDPTTYVPPGPAVWSASKGGSIAQIGVVAPVNVTSLPTDISSD